MDLWATLSQAHAGQVGHAGGTCGSMQGSVTSFNIPLSFLSIKSYSRMVCSSVCMYECIHIYHLQIHFYFIHVHSTARKVAI